MPERFFFDWVDMKRNRLTVDSRIKRAVDVSPDFADSSVSRTNDATVRAQRAFNRAVRARRVAHSLVKHRCIILRFGRVVIRLCCGFDIGLESGESGLAGGTWVCRRTRK